MKFAFVKHVGEALEEAFGKEVVERWKKMGDGRKRGPSRRGRGGDDVNDDDDKWDGSEGGDNQDMIERRGVVLVGSRVFESLGLEVFFGMYFFAFFCVMNYDEI